MGGRGRHTPAPEGSSQTLVLVALVVNLSYFDKKNAESTQLFVPFPPCIELTHRELPNPHFQGLGASLLLPEFSFFFWQKLHFCLIFRADSTPLSRTGGQKAW